MFVQEEKCYFVTFNLIKRSRQHTLVYIFFYQLLKAVLLQYLQAHPKFNFLLNIFFFFWCFIFYFLKLYIYICFCIPRRLFSLLHIMIYLLLRDRNNVLEPTQLVYMIEDIYSRTSLNLKDYIREVTATLYWNKVDKPTSIKRKYTPSFFEF